MFSPRYSRHTKQKVMLSVGEVLDMYKVSCYYDWLQQDWQNTVKHEIFTSLAFSEWADSYDGGMSHIHTKLWGLSHIHVLPLKGVSRSWEQRFCSPGTPDSTYFRKLPRNYSSTRALLCPWFAMLYGRCNQPNLVQSVQIIDWQTSSHLKFWKQLCLVRVVLDHTAENTSTTLHIIYIIHVISSAKGIGQWHCHW